MELIKALIIAISLEVGVPPESTIRYAYDVIRRFNELSGGRAPVLIGRR